MEQTKKIDITYLSPELLVSNPWNSNVMSLENETKLAESLKRNNMYDAIIARQLFDGSYQILGGEHRTRVAKKIGILELPVIVLKNISDNQAKEISLTHNARYGADDSLKLSDLLNSLDDASILTDIMPYSIIEIETLMSASKIDFDSLVGLDFDDDEIDELSEKTFLPKTHTIMRFKVSIEDAASIEEMLKETIKINGFTESDALTNAGDALVHCLLSEA
jgi:ParB family chromosome partitioning protein